MKIKLVIGMMLLLPVQNMQSMAPLCKPAQKVLESFFARAVACCIPFGTNHGQRLMELSKEHRNLVKKLDRMPDYRPVGHIIQQVNAVLDEMVELEDRLQEHLLAEERAWKCTQQEMQDNPEGFLKHIAQLVDYHKLELDECE